MFSFFSDRPGFGLGLAAGLVVAVAVAGGYFLGRGDNNLSPGLFERAVRADSASTGQQFAICTGPIDDQEGLCTLDFVTGDMQIAVLNPRSGKWGGLFKGNVLTELVPEKGKPSKYLLSSGQISFQRGAGTTAGQPARSVFYVLDENTGKYAAYSIFWNRNAASQGQPQVGQIVAVDIPGLARNAPVVRPN